MTTILFGICLGALLIALAGMLFRLERIERKLDDLAGRSGRRDRIRRQIAERQAREDARR